MLEIAHPHSTLPGKPSTAKSSAAWKIPEMETPVSVASCNVVVAARPAKPCNWRLRRGSKMWRGSEDKVEAPRIGGSLDYQCEGTDEPCASGFDALGRHGLV